MENMELISDKKSNSVKNCIPKAIYSLSVLENPSYHAIKHKNV